MTISGAVAVIIKVAKFVKAVITLKRVRQWIMCQRGHHDWCDEPYMRYGWVDHQRAFYSCKHCGASKEEIQR